MKNLLKQIRDWWSGQVPIEKLPDNKKSGNILEYGYDRTIHQTGEVNVERDSKTGEVVAVWFRCMPLPFTVTDFSRTKEMREMYKTGPIHRIVAIVFEINE